METFDWALDQLATVVAVTGGTAMLIFSAFLFRRWFAMRRFRQVRGRIIDVRLRLHPHDEGEYSTETTYEYHAGGQTFRRRTEDDNRIARLYSLAGAERVKRQMERQRKIWVRYDPARPEVAVGGEPRSQAIKVGLGMMAAGSALLVMAAHVQGIVDLEPYFQYLGSFFPSWLNNDNSSGPSSIG